MGTPCTKSVLMLIQSAVALATMTPVLPLSFLKKAARLELFEESGAALKKAARLRNCAVIKK